MKIISRLMLDVLLLEPSKKNEEGVQTMVFSKGDLAKVGIHSEFVQENESLSYKNVLRGLHYQITHPQGKLIRVVSGSIFDAVVDIRRSSPFFGKSTCFSLSDENGLMAWIPPGYAHGFYVTSDYAKIIYNVTDYRVQESERTLLWSDKVLGIEWPIGENSPLLSEKDANGHLFQDFKDVVVFNK
jgi:dTDP-4-dehydrorhamnose 3,5-epimerase